MIGAIILGLVAGAIGKLLVPNDKAPGGFFGTLFLGLAGALVGYLIFTVGLGIGDDDKFDLGGIVSAIIGVIIVVIVYGAVQSRSGSASRH